MAERKSYTPEEFVTLIHEMRWEKEIRRAMHFNSYNFNYKMLEDSHVEKDEEGFCFHAKNLGGELIRVPIVDNGDPAFKECFTSAMEHPDKTKIAAISIKGVEHYRIECDDDERKAQKALEDYITIKFLQRTGIEYKFQLLNLFAEANGMIKKHQQMQVKQQMMKAQLQSKGQKHVYKIPASK